MIGVLVGMYTSGCARGEPAPAAPTHDHFRAIQEEEARIASGGAVVDAEVARAEPACDRACAAVDEVCDAAERLCRVARAVDDADARKRCRRGRASCRSASTRAAEQCACGGDTP
ncbi:MAG: hypothetical protein ACODAU_05205 [Myxococcota bacterium]